MARTIKPLTDTEVKSAKAGNKDLTLFDGGGLELLVRASGSKTWRYRWKSPITNKRSVITIGNYPIVTLKDARAKATIFTQQVSNGDDPRNLKIQEQQEKLARINNTFLKVATDYYQFYKTKGFKEYAVKRFWRSLEIHVLPDIGHMAITSLTPPIVIPLLRRMSERGQATNAKRVERMINQIMDHAMNIGVIAANPLAKISNVLITTPAKNNPTIRPEELPNLYDALIHGQIELQTKLVIEWQLLTMTRPIEAASAKWEQIDLEQGLWVLPATAMKMEREHIVVLCSQALDVLEAMKPISSNKAYIFPHRNKPNEPMSSQSANKALKALGFKDKQTAHGLRALTSTILNEAGHNKDLIEHALAHVDKNSVRAVYNRSLYIEPRKPMMEWLGNFVQEAAGGRTMGQITLSSYRKRTIT